MDIELYYEEKGDGDPLILLHGNGEDHEYFKNQIPFFAKKYRVIAIDTRGHGRSPRGNAPFRIRQFAEDLRAFMDKRRLKKRIFWDFLMEEILLWCSRCGILRGSIS